MKNIFEREKPTLSEISPDGILLEKPFDPTDRKYDRYYEVALDEIEIIRISPDYYSTAADIALTRPNLLKKILRNDKNEDLEQAFELFSDRHLEYHDINQRPHKRIGHFSSTITHLSIVFPELIPDLLPLVEEIDSEIGFLNDKDFEDLYSDKLRDNQVHFSFAYYALFCKELLEKGSVTENEELKQKLSERIKFHKRNNWRNWSLFNSLLKIQKVFIPEEEIKEGEIEQVLKNLEVQRSEYIKQGEQVLGYVKAGRILDTLKNINIITAQNATITENGLQLAHGKGFDALKPEFVPTIKSF